MPSYLSADDITTRLQNAATTSGHLCVFGTCPNATPGDSAKGISGRNPPYVEITSPTIPANPRIVVVVTGGVHAREWAPPDALVSFVETMLATKGTAPVSYPLLTQQSLPYHPFPTDPDTPMLYPAVTIDAPSVQRIFNTIDLYIAPLMNPDGREFSRQGGQIPAWWRKNRRGGTAGCIDTFGNDQGIGVDVNRNFDIGWEFPTLYSAASQKQIKSAAVACPGPSTIQHDNGETFRGTVKMDEPEVKNIDWLQQQGDGARVFVDVHSSGPHILFPWGLSDGDQSTQPAQNIRNTGLDGTRDASYREFVPPLTAARQVVMAGRMAHSVLRTQTLDPRVDDNKDPTVRRFSAQYFTDSSGHGLYLAPGACEDYHFSRQFVVDPATFAETTIGPERFAFTIECGTQGQGGFFPDFTHEFPKIEREVHMALWGLLSFVASPAFTAPVSWPTKP